MERAGASNNPLAHLARSAKETGLVLARRFARAPLAFDSVARLPGDGYKTACEWYGALKVAHRTNERELFDSLVTKFEGLEGDFLDAMTGGAPHVDRYVFGIVPLEIHRLTRDPALLELGTRTADAQRATRQARGAVDDMFMMTALQLQSHRATGNATPLDFMSRTMVEYLEAQQKNGLFFHNVKEARVHWCRGNGWFAAGMAEMLGDLPPAHPSYARIAEGFTRMMAGLLACRSKNGLWCQVLDDPENASNWEESSGSAMFTYAMIAGVRSGRLAAETYVPVIEAAWAGLRSKISPEGDVADVCIGTWYRGSAREYMAAERLVGDGHGQAPVLWALAELLA